MHVNRLSRFLLPCRTEPVICTTKLDAAVINVVAHLHLMACCIIADSLGKETDADENSCSFPARELGAGAALSKFFIMLSYRYRVVKLGGK